MISSKLSKNKKIISILKRERGSALVIAILVMVVMTVLGLGILMVTDIESKISDNYRSQTQALYVAESGIERLIYYLNNPSQFTDTNGTYSGYTCSTTLEAQNFFAKRRVVSNAPSYFNVSNLSQYDDSNNDGTSDGHDSSNPVLQYDRSTNTAQQTFLESITPDVSSDQYISQLMVFAPPSGVEAVCTVRCTAIVRDTKRIVEQVLMPGPVLAFTAGLSSGVGASFNGNIIQVHWGPIRILNTPADINTNLNQAPIRTPDAAIDSTSFVGVNPPDRWLRVLTSTTYSPAVDEASYQNPPAPAGKQNVHQFESPHNNLFANQTGLTIDYWDYHEAKRIAQRYGTYYTMNGSGQLLLDGEGSPLDFMAVTNTESVGIVFIDTTNQLEPGAGGTMDTISISGAYWTKGIFYIAANWSSTGLGNGLQNQTVLAPPILPGPSSNLRGSINAGSTTLTVTTGTTAGMSVGDILCIGKKTGSNYTHEELIITNVVDSTTLTVETTAPKTGMTPTGAWFNHNNLDFTNITTLDESTRSSVTGFQYNFAGAMYVTGTVDMQGGPNFYGSIVARGGFAGGGNPEIWFDWDLTKCDLTKYGIPNVVKGAWREIY